jgi:hypothetical protein
MAIEREKNLYPGADWLKVRSGRIAQIQGLDRNHVWLCWDDGRQTVVKRERLRTRTKEWQPCGSFRPGGLVPEGRMVA